MNDTTHTIRTRGLLFDMDGVLISSIGSVNRCWREWARRYGLPNADSFQVPHGQRAIDIVRMLRPDIDAHEGLRSIEDLELNDTADLRVLPGVRELLASLPPERWTIVTSATRRLMLDRLKIAGLPAPARLIAADDVTHGKPHPEPYRRGAEILGLAIADCLVIEDAPSGVGAGRAAGACVLAVLGTHTASELTYATWIVPSLEGLHVEVLAEELLLRLPAGSIHGADAACEISPTGQITKLPDPSAALA